MFLFAYCRFPQPGPVAQNLQWLTQAEKSGIATGALLIRMQPAETERQKTPKRREKKGGVSVIQSRRELSIHTPFLFLRLAT